MLVSFIYIGSMHTREEFLEYKADVAVLNQKNLQDHKNIIRHETEEAVEFIRHRQQQMHQMVRDRLMFQVEQTLFTMKQFVDKARQDGEQVTIDYVKKQLSEFISRFPELQFILCDMRGTMIELPGGVSRSAQAGLAATVLREQDIQEMIRLVKKEQAGYYSLYSQPDITRQEASGQPDIVYVSRFEPLDWMVGLMMPAEIVEKQIKDEVASFLGKVRFAEGGYLFGGQWDGYCLFGPDKGQNLLQVTDARGRKAVSDVIMLSQNGGGFIENIMPSGANRAGRPKISYTLAIEEWRWYIGAGIYVQSIQAQIDRRAGELRGILRKELRNMVLSMLGVLVVTTGLNILLARRIKRQIDSFISFFNRVAQTRELVEIDCDRFSFKEYRQLGTAANEMVHQRLQLENELQGQMIHSITLAQQAAAANQVKSNFLIRLSHELKTPMNAILGFSGILLQESLSADQRDSVTYINNAARDLDRLLSDMLTCAGMQGDDIQYTPGPCALQELLAMIQKRMTQKLQNRDLFFRIVVPQRLAVLIVTDSDNLLLCLNHLLDNAVKFTPAGQVRLTVSGLWREGGYHLRFEIADSGVGIAPDRIDTIFGLFSQGEEQLNRKFEGVGLGLAIVKMIVDKLGGAMKVESQEGKGSCFSLIIPDDTLHPTQDRQWFDQADYDRYYADCSQRGEAAKQQDVLM